MREVIEPERMKYLREEVEAGRASYSELIEIDYHFNLIPVSQLCDDPENATAGDMLDEIELAQRS